jgi:hypothetical protein
MAGKPRPVLTEDDRLLIGKARETLQTYGLYVDVADMSDVGYEKRICRMKAMDLAVDYARTCTNATDEKVIKAAGKFYDYIWEGKTLDDE